MRNYKLDLIRVTAMFLIVLMHSPMPGTPGFLQVGITYITMPGIGLFFMVSGALLLKSDLSQADFLKRRFTKILWPTFFGLCFI